MGWEREERLNPLAAETNHITTPSREERRTEGRITECALSLGIEGCTGPVAPICPIAFEGEARRQREVNLSRTESWNRDPTRR